MKPSQEYPTFVRGTAHIDVDRWLVGDFRNIFVSGSLASLAWTTHLCRGTEVNRGSLSRRSRVQLLLP